MGSGDERSDMAGKTKQEELHLLNTIKKNKDGKMFFVSSNYKLDAGSKSWPFPQQQFYSTILKHDYFTAAIIDSIKKANQKKHCNIFNIKHHFIYKYSDYTFYTNKFKYLGSLTFVNYYVGKH